MCRCESSVGLAASYHSHPPRPPAHCQHPHCRGGLSGVQQLLQRLLIIAIKIENRIETSSATVRNRYCLYACLPCMQMNDIEPHACRNQTLARRSTPSRGRMQARRTRGYQRPAPCSARRALCLQVNWRLTVWRQTF